MAFSGEPKFYEYIVVGLGGLGSAALYWLSLRSKSVLGLEQFQLAHDRGGSQDWSRIIRYMYHDSKYVKLAKASYQTWSDVEKESGQKLVHKIGSLELTSMNGPTADILDMYEKAMKENDVPYERLKAAEIQMRWPQWQLPNDIQAVYQADGGLVDAALANSTHIQLAEAHGASLIENCRVIGFTKDARGTILVSTTNGNFKCRKIVICSGSWTNEVVSSIGVHVPLWVTQEQVTYMRTPNVKDFIKEKFPVYIFNIDNYDFYGFPSHVNSYSKIGIDAGGPRVTPGSRSYTPDPVREAACIKFLEKYSPKCLGPIAYTKTCLYAMTLDRDFIIDDLASKGWPEISLVIGAGHAFKFASIIGKILSEMAIDGRTNQDISGFCLNRPAVTDPNFKPAFLMLEKKEQEQRNSAPKSQL